MAATLPIVDSNLSAVSGLQGAEVGRLDEKKIAAFSKTKAAISVCIHISKMEECLSGRKALRKYFLIE